MRIFLLVVGLACLVFVLSFMGKPEVPSSPVVDATVEAPVVVETTPYAHGYLRGYASFRRQMGEDYPLPPVARYSADLDGHEISEDEMRGYVDGYHRAADMGYGGGCTRDCTK